MKSSLSLRLPLEKKWFEMTDPEGKTEDYREITEYWIRRLTKCSTNLSDAKEQLLKGGAYLSELYKYFALPDYCFPKEFSTNIMTLGYPSKSDISRIKKYEHKGIEVRTGKPEWGAEPNKIYFVIMHGPSAL